MAPTPRSSKRRRKKQTQSQKLDEALATSDLDDQLVVFWNRYKNQVVLVVLVALATIVGIQGEKWWSAKSLSDRSAAYSTATTEVEKEAFADKNAKHNIGGAAYLELADMAYSDEDFSKAGDLYEKALRALDLIPLEQRAHLGLALATLQAGNTEDGLERLQAVANHGDYLDMAKAEALYHLSVTAWERANYPAMLDYHDQIDELVNPGLWQSKAQSLQRTVPELKALVEERLNEEPAADNLDPGLEN